MVLSSGGDSKWVPLGSEEAISFPDQSTALEAARDDKLTPSEFVIKKGLDLAGHRIGYN